MISRSFLVKCLFLLLFILLGITNSGCKKKRDIFKYPYIASFKDQSESYALVFLSSLEGYVEPCGCTRNPLGGIARFATVFSDIKLALNDRVDLIGAGNMLFESEERNEADKCQDDEKIKLLLSTLKDFGLKYTAFGPLDNARGTSFRDEIFKSYGVSLLGSGVGKILGDIAVIGVNEPLPDIKMAQSNIQKLAKSLKEKHKVKALVAVSQMPEARTREIFFDLAHIDIVIQGQVSSMVPKTPAKLGDGPIYIEGGRQGQYLTLLLFQNLSKRKEQKLSIDNRAFEKSAREDLLNTRILALKEQLAAASPDRLSFIESRLKMAQAEFLKLKGSALPMSTVPSVAFHAIDLTKKIESNPVVKEKLLAYEKSIPTLVKKCEENIECPKAEPGAATYVGVETCKNCHVEAFNVWKNAIVSSKGLDESGKEYTRMVGHSKAWKTLEEVNKDADRSCIGCHSIGFMQKGGYCKAFDVGFRKDVQCESCHGAGSLHAQTGDKKFITRNVTEETCRGCHHVPHIPSYESFVYQEKVMKILGVGHGEKLLKELTHNKKP